MLPILPILPKKVMFFRVLLDFQRFFGTNGLLTTETCATAPAAQN
jgi:hypothetical protein